MAASIKKTLAITLALLFIAIVLIALASGWEKQKQQEKEAQSTQTTYVIVDSSSPSYTNYEKYSNPISNRYYPINYENRYEHNYYENYPEEPKIIKDYSYSEKKEQEKDFLGSYITKYTVSVLNKGNTGNYFIVTFNFKTQEDFEYSEAITQYLRAGERKEFLYKDVQFERTEILGWSYKVERV
jgi:ABC-type antimicrobial peptide transport system permease subunit